MPMQPTLCRNALFTPADRTDRYQKAGSIALCDAIVIDLEDAVSVENKDSARKVMFSWFFENKIDSSHPMLTFIRINGLDTLYGLQDIVALLKSDFVPDALLLPKVQSAQEIDIYTSLFRHERFQHMAFVALIETAYGMQYAHEIASREKVVAIAFGGADLTSDLGAELTFESTIAYRSRIVQAASYAGKVAWDVPYLNFHNEEGLRKETIQIKHLGFSAKMAIHPAQLAPIAEILSPSKDEIEEAASILRVFDEAKGNACSYKGKMIDTALVKHCRTVINKSKNLTI